MIKGGYMIVCPQSASTPLVQSRVMVFQCLQDTSRGWRSVAESVREGREAIAYCPPVVI